MFRQSNFQQLVLTLRKQNITEVTNFLNQKEVELQQLQDGIIKMEKLAMKLFIQPTIELAQITLKKDVTEWPNLLPMLLLLKAARKNPNEDVELQKTLEYCKKVHEQYHHMVKSFADLSKEIKIASVILAEKSITLDNLLSMTAQSTLQ